ncbi:hypothetical protein CPA46_07845 [Sphingopyxis terrae subsp. ummariensis]|nr:hypothetical protein CPA46_07845 [Sphingopyxis terrae subsp. ummariensis]
MRRSRGHPSLIKSATRGCQCDAANARKNSTRLYYEAAIHSRAARAPAAKPGIFPNRTSDRKLRFIGLLRPLLTPGRGRLVAARLSGEEPAGGACRRSGGLTASLAATSIARALGATGAFLLVLLTASFGVNLLTARFSARSIARRPAQTALLPVLSRRALICRRLPVRIGRSGILLVGVHILLLHAAILLDTAGIDIALARALVGVRVLRTPAVAILDASVPFLAIVPFIFHRCFLCACEPLVRAR